MEAFGYLGSIGHLKGCWRCGSPLHHGAHLSHVTFHPTTSHPSQHPHLPSSHCNTSANHEVAITFDERSKQWLPSIWASSDRPQN